MDRRKFVLSSVAGSSVLFGLAGKVALSPRLTSHFGADNTIGQSDFEKMVSLSLKNKETLFLPPGSKILINKVTRINTSIHGQGSHFHIEQGGQLCFENTLSQDTHLRNFNISSNQENESLVSIIDARNMLLENLNISSINATPIAVSKSQNVHVMQSRISFSGLTGIEVRDSRDIHVLKNIFMSHQNLNKNHDFLTFDNVGEAHITDNLFNSKKDLAGLSFIGQPADQKSIVKNNKFAAS